MRKKAKNAAERLAREEEDKARMNKQLQDARQVEAKPQPVYDQMPSNLEGKRERDFITLKVEQHFPLAEKARTPTWITDELLAGKTKKFPQRLIEQFNFVRQHPQHYAHRLRDLLPLFSVHLLDQAIFKCPEIFCEDTLKEGISGIEGLIAHLEGLQPMKPLALAPALSTACLDLIEIQGPKGLEGLDGETEEERKARFFRYVKTTGGIASQIMSYGPFMPVHVALQMLLDDGQKERPKRKEILNPEWGVVGIHAGKHAKSMFMTVCLFAHDLL